MTEQRKKQLEKYFTPTLKHLYFAYLHGFSDNFPFPKDTYNFHDYIRTAFGKRYISSHVPVTEDEQIEILGNWLLEFIEIKNATKV